MIGTATVLVIVTVSLLATRVGSSALEATGVSADLAHFQARSAFTGVGFTTSESERVANHPARRRIILVLMLLGNAGIVSVIASLVVGFVGAESQAAALRLLVLAAGLLGLWLLARTNWFNRLISSAIERGLRRWSDMDVRDYVQLLDVSGDYAVRDQEVREGDWLVGTVLRDLDLTAEGVLVLGIRRANGEFIGAPRPDTEIRNGDTVVLYGREESLHELEDRARGSEGDAEHVRGVDRQERVQVAERIRDQTAEARR